MSTSAELLQRAATRLRNPLLCNWDHAVAHALADVLSVEEGRTLAGASSSTKSNQRLNCSVADLARALLRSFGHACGDSDSPCRSCALTEPAEAVPRERPVRP